VRFGTPEGRPDLFVVNWNSVGYYDQHDDKLNNFQLILEDLSALQDFAPGDVLITFNYGQIQWETGDASGGTDGLGGSSARVGFSNGSGRPGTFFELPGSGASRALLDGRRLSLIGNRIPNNPSLPLGRYQFVVKNGEISEADLAIAVEMDNTGFDIIVFNFGPLDARDVQIQFATARRIAEFRPSDVCRLNGDFVICEFPVIADGDSRSIRVQVREPVRGTAAITGSSVLDSDLVNNLAQAPSCKGQILSQSEPPSVEYEPTATEPARRRLRLAMINTANDETVRIRRIRFRDLYTDPNFGTPLQISRIRPPLPVTIGPGGEQLFRVDTIVPAGMTARTAQRPYFTFQVRCLN
jgi:hypothetical protein